VTAAAPFDAIILGAGGAGLMCAATAGQRGRRVAVVDHRAEPGAKIVISGGGRCNFTNREADNPERYLSANPHFARSALGRYGPYDFLALVERHGIEWHEKTLGQLFCQGRASAGRIVRMLLDECPPGSVEWRLGEGVRDVSHADGLFRVATDRGPLSAPRLVIATGGPSIPKLGATGFAYDLARRFGLKVVEPRPALVPLTLPPTETLFRELSGVSVPVVARCRDASFAEAALFTHRGLSGPAILQVSSYWRRGEDVAVDFLPGAPPEWLRAAKRARPDATLRRALGAHLPDRLAAALAERLGPGPLGGARDAVLAEHEARLAGWRFAPNGTEGFAKAEVTAGGVSTAGLNQRDLSARHLPGLHVVGEAVDVTGWLGGYNFHWAWASGRAAGEAI